MGQVFALRDPVSAGTHFVGFLWAIFGALLLCRLCRSDRPKQFSLACFGGSMIGLYAASALYHAVRLPPDELEFFRLLDHSAIYLLIAGTYTPIFFGLLRGKRRDAFLAMMWTLAALGIAWKWTLPVRHYPLTVTVYIFMGWVGVLAIVDMTRAVGFRAISLGVLGGLFYMGGAVSDLAGWPVIYPGVFGPHEVLHVCVLAGNFCHFIFVAQYVVPYPRYRLRRPRTMPLPDHGTYEGLAVAAE